MYILLGKSELFSSTAEDLGSLRLIGNDSDKKPLQSPLLCVKPILVFPSRITAASCLRFPRLLHNNISVGLYI